MGAPYTLRLLEEVPGLRLVFDTGNPVITPDYTLPAPRPRQSAWEFYRQVRDFVDCVHVKDAVFLREKPGAIFDEAEFTFPDEGHAQLRRIVADLLARGYTGGFSIEPHMSVVFHLAEGHCHDDARFAGYVEYGRRFMALVDEVRAGQALPD
jgi:sugar phosphate isomerase/epimerase